MRLSVLCPQIFFPWHKETAKMGGNLKKIQVQRDITQQISERVQKHREQAVLNQRVVGLHGPR